MSDLTGTLPTLQALYQQLQTYGASVGITFDVADYGGLRTQADTTTILDDRQADYTAAVASGAIAADTTLNAFRPISPFGSSYHNYGAAFDVQILSSPGLTDEQALATLGAYAPSIGLRWGGTFSNPDTPHFELAESLTQAQSDYQTATGLGIAGNASTDGAALASQADVADGEDIGFPWGTVAVVGAVLGILAWLGFSARRTSTHGVTA